MRRKISDSVVVITGASSGIGRATAIQLARQGATLVLAARGEQGLVSAAEDCEEFGVDVHIVPTDVTDEDQMLELANEAVETFGRIDAWINNAGVAAFSSVEETPVDLMHQVMDTNFFGCVHGAKAVIPYFREQGYGTLINVSSSAGRTGAPYMAAYSASKFAINGFTESLRMELADCPGVRVCAVVPGSTDTPLFWHAANYTGHALKPVEPILEPERVADAIVKCIIRPRREMLVGRLARLAAFSRFLPRALVEPLVAARTRRDHFMKEPEASGVGNVFEPVGPFHSVSGHWLEMFPPRRNWVLPTSLVIAAVAGVWFWRRGSRLT